MSGLDSMLQRLHYGGGDQDGRNVKGKLVSMQSALWNSYQGEWITFNKKKYRCLINSDKVSVDYDQKIISIDFSAKMKPGDTFYWDRTDHWWIAFNRRYEEEAYFRADLRRCDYQISTEKNKYWIYVRGPVETALVWNQKHQISFNDLNYSIEFFINKNEDTLDFFSRHQKVKFEGHNWKVAATDKYSQDGVIEVFLQEDFDNTMEDNMIIPEIIKPDTSEVHIEGPQRVKPYDTNLIYSIESNITGEFVVDSKKVKIVNSTETSCELEIITGKSANFQLLYRNGNDTIASLDIVVESF